MKKSSVDMTTNIQSSLPNAEDPFNWVASSSPLLDSHVTSVKKMTQQYFHTTTTTTAAAAAAGHHNYIHLDGTSLTIAQVASVARRKDAYSKVRLDVGSAKERVEMSSNWVLNHVPTTQEYPNGITTGFNARSKLHTHHSLELIRFLNAGILSNKNSPALNPNALAPEVSRAAMLVRTNTLLKGFSGIRWPLLESMRKLINAGICVKLPSRGTITASSGDMLPLSYIAGLLTGRPNSRALDQTGSEMSAQEALRLIGIERPFDLLPEEATAIVSGTSVGSALASIVCYDANVLSLLAVVLSALFCEVMLGEPEFADPFVHSLNHHPGQIEAASIMEWILEGSSYMKASIKCGSSQSKPTHHTQDRCALRTSPQWLGPQIEVIRFATQLIEREINSVTDDAIVDVTRNKALHGGNSQGTTIGVAMDHVRLALASIGKLMFAQFSELVNDFCSNGLTSNLSAGPNPSLDYGFKGAEIAMASYTSELQFLANPVTNHVQSAEQHNQDVNSLGLISARKTAEAIEVLKMMASTYMLALCQAVDLRHLEENLMEGVKETVCAAWEQVLTSSFCSEKDILAMLRSLPVFSYADDPMSPSYPFLERLRQVIVEHGLKEVELKAEARGGDGGGSHAMIEKVSKFEEELRQTLGPCLVNVRVAFDRGTCKTPKRIAECRSYPIYEFVRNELGTKLLVGTHPRSPGQDIELLFDALSDGSFVQPLLNCLKGFPHLL